MKRWIPLVLAVLSLGLAAGAQHIYAVYYDRSLGGDLDINFLNPNTGEVGVKIRIYDAYGDLVLEDSFTLSPHNAAYGTLSQLVPEEGENWGLILAESTAPIAIGLEYYEAGGDLVTVETIASALPSPVEGGHYVLLGYYTQAGEASTGIVLMNPWGDPVGCAVSVYDSSGNLLHQEGVELGAHEAEYGDLTDVVGSDGEKWGLIKIESTGAPVAVALEYYGRSHAGLEIDNLDYGPGLRGAPEVHPGSPGGKKA